MNKKNHIYLLSIILILLCFVKKREYFTNQSIDYNRYCIIIPVYPPHYKYVKHILDSITDIDLYFVFTTQDDYKQFSYDSKNNIILDEHITKEQISLLTNKKSLPSFKKLFAMNLLYEKYDYILCIDAETKVLKQPDLKRIYETNVVVGGINNSSRINNIIKGSLKMFKDVSEKKLMEISDNFTYYTWWSSMPIYKTNNISDFMERIGFNKMDNFINEIEYNFFENLAYNYYCILYQNFKKIVVPNINHSLEGQSSSIVEKYIDYNLGWISLNTYKQNPEFYDNKDNIYMVYHLDRSE